MKNGKVTAAAVATAMAATLLLTSSPVAEGSIPSSNVFGLSPSLVQGSNINGWAVVPRGGSTDY
eukprot:10405936-Ditylum_brightwellii.AAC.1